MPSTIQSLIGVAAIDFLPALPLWFYTWRA